MNKRLKIDIIIVAYNSADILIRCLNSIDDSDSEAGYTVTIVNNEKSDNLSELYRRFPKARIITNYQNVGFAKAVNIALNIGNAPFICLLNPDTIIFKHFFNNCIDYLTIHPKVGILGSKIYNEDGTLQGSARSFPTMLTSFFGRDSWLTRIFPNNPISKQNILTIEHLGEEPIEVDWVSGASMIVRREAANNVGGMDERFFMYWEDADWCRRMRQMGWKIVYYPKAAISHFCGQSSKTRPLKSIFHFHKSCYRLYEKYTSSYQVILLPIVLLGLSVRMSLLLLNTIIRQKLSRNF